jgi:hypothetical protein
VGDRCIRPIEATRVRHADQRRGSMAADLPIFLATKFELVINLSWI